MRGSPVKQVQDLFHQSVINKIGESKHDAKEIARSNLTHQDKASTWHNMGKQMGIHSYKTADAYREIWINVFRGAKENFHIKDIENLKSDHVQHYLETKINEGVSKNTFMQYASACEKLSVALNMYAEKNDTGKTYHFSNNISNVRADAHKMLERSDQSRAYENPQALINTIKNETYQLAAQIQLEAGTRINETSIFREHNLKEITEHTARGEVGKIHLDGWVTKGGKERDVFVSKETYQRLENVINQKGEFRIKDQTYYRSLLNEAAKESNQSYNGSHGLRWNFARDELKQFMASGKTYEESLILVSHEMGHVRGDITEHYLK